MTRDSALAAVLWWAKKVQRQIRHAVGNVSYEGERTQVLVEGPD